MRRPDPFDFCQQQGITVKRQPSARRYLTGIFLGRVFVYLKAGMTDAQERHALAAALLKHPVAPLAVSRT